MENPAESTISSFSPDVATENSNHNDAVAPCKPEQQPDCEEKKEVEPTALCRGEGDDNEEVASSEAVSQQQSPLAKQEEESTNSNDAVPSIEEKEVLAANGCNVMEKEKEDPVSPAGAEAVAAAVAAASVLMEADVPTKGQRREEKCKDDSNNGEGGNTSLSEGELDQEAIGNAAAAPDSALSEGDMTPANPADTGEKETAGTPEKLVSAGTAEGDGDNRGCKAEEWIGRPKDGSPPPEISSQQNDGSESLPLTRSKMDTLLPNVSDTEKELIELKMALAVAKSKVDEQHLIMVKISEERYRVTTEMQAVLADNETLKKRNKNLDKLYGTLDEKNAKDTKELDEIKVEAAALREEVLTLRKKVKTLESDKRKLENTLAKSNNEVERSSAKFQTLLGKNANLLTDKASLQTELQGVKKALNKTTRESRRVSTEKERIERSLSEVSAVRDSLQGSLGGIMTERNALQSDVRKLSEENNDLERQLDKALMGGKKRRGSVGGKGASDDGDAAANVAGGSGGQSIGKGLKKVSKTLSCATQNMSPMPPSKKSARGAGLPRFPSSTSSQESVENKVGKDGKLLKLKKGFWGSLSSSLHGGSRHGKRKNKKESPESIVAKTVDPPSVTSSPMSTPTAIERVVAEDEDMAATVDTTKDGGSDEQPVDMKENEPESPPLLNQVVTPDKPMEKNEDSCGAKDQTPETEEEETPPKVVAPDVPQEAALFMTP